MKLRNKETGEIVEIPNRINLNSGSQNYGFGSLAELNEEWEDYEEPKEFWYIDCYGDVQVLRMELKYLMNCRQSIGDYFETKEEAEKAVEKLKAWKRLKDKGIKVIDRGWDKLNNINKEDDSVIYIKMILDTETYDCSCDEALDLLFGGEE